MITVKVIGSFKRVPLPNEGLEWTGPSRWEEYPDDLRSEVLAFIANKRKEVKLPGGMVHEFVAPTSLAQITERLRISTSHASELVRKLLDAGEVFEWFDSKGKRCLSTKPAPSQGPAKTLADIVREMGHVTTSELKKGAHRDLLKGGKDSWTAQGVHAQRVGNAVYLSFGPLPKEFLDRHKQAQQIAKTNRDVDAQRARRAARRRAQVEDDLRARIAAIATERALGTPEPFDDETVKMYERCRTRHRHDFAVDIAARSFIARTFRVTIPLPAPVAHGRGLVPDEPEG